MVSLHADHLIEPISGFVETVASAVEIAARDDLLLSIGVPPQRVEIGYGHIEPGEVIESESEVDAYRVRAFHEKPDAETAQRYVDDGYLWNTGIFIWKASTLLAEIEQHAPEVAEHLPRIEESDTAFFDAVPVSVIDRAVMERSDRVATVAARFTWDDVGSWEALARTRPADSRENVILGPGHAVDSSGNVIYAEGDASVVVLGVDDLIVVQSGGTTMVLPRSRAGEMKALLARMEGRKP
jgi:mannose-1-phosphate guanylyltransferase